MEEKTDQGSDVSAMKIQVKTEPPDEDIQDYAEDTMNELLAIYGYNEKVEHGVTQTMQLAPKYRKEERGLRKRLLVAHASKGDTASECSVSGNVTPVSGSGSAEEEPGSPSSSQDTPEMLEALQEGKCSDRGNKDHIICAWCKSPGFKNYTLNTNTESKAFCSERCFASCRRAYFKRNKVCDWCRHTRHLQDYIYLIDGERRLQFCSSKCMNQYKMDSYYKDGPSLRRKVTKANATGGGGGSSKSNGSAPVSPTLDQQSFSERNSPDTASQDASIHDSQPSPSNIPLSGVFQTNSSSSQSMMGMPQLRPSGVYGVQTVMPQAMSFRQVVPQMPVVQVVGSGGMPLNLVQGLNQSSTGSHKSSSRLSQQQWGIPGMQGGGSSFKKIRPKPQSSSATMPTSTVTSASNSVPFTNRKVHHDIPSSTSAAGGNSLLPPVTVMVPHPVFIPIPVPIPIPIPVCKEVYEAAMEKVKENAKVNEQEATTSYDDENHGSSGTKKKSHNVSDMFMNGSSHLPSSSSTGAFVPYRSHHADMQDSISNSTDGHSMEAMLSSSLQTSLNIPQSSSAAASASEALESRRRHQQPQRHPSLISTATVEAMHRSINSRMLRHKCLQRSASMDLSFGRYNTLSALTDFLGDKHGFNPLMHSSHGRRDLSADSHGLSTRASHSNLPTKPAGELSPSVREALRCHLTRRLSQSALNLTDVGRYPEEDRLRRSQSMSRLQEDSDNIPHHEMEAISSHTSLEKLADTSDSSEHVDPKMFGGGSGGIEDMPPANKRRCLGSPNQID